jgi:hypothetical protein
MTKCESCGKPVRTWDPVWMLAISEDRGEMKFALWCDQCGPDVVVRVEGDPKAYSPRRIDPVEVSKSFDSQHWWQRCACVCGFLWWRLTVLMGFDR